MMERTRKPLKARVEKKHHQHIQINAQKQRQLAQIFSSSGWLSVNRGLMKTYGALPAIFMSQIIDSFIYWSDRDQLQSDGSFFVRSKDIADSLGMSEHQIRRCKKEMKDAGVLFTMMKGIPPKEYYFLDIGIILLSVYRINPKEIRGLTLKEMEEYIKDYNNKKPNKEKDYPQPSKKINPDQFEEFWKLYPRKVGKPAAKLKWNSLSKKPDKDQPSFETIKNSIQAYKDSGEWDVERYIPHPTTWLNQERWNDDIPKRSERSAPKRLGIGTMATQSKEVNDSIQYPDGEIHDPEGGSE